MKKVHLIIPCLLFIALGCKKIETVETVTSADFIDPGLYGYLQANYDFNGDLVFQPEEIAAVKKLDLTKEDYIYNLKGIEKLTELEELNIDRLKIQTKDLVINNPRLKTLDCGYIGLTSLDVSQCTELESLACYENKLTTLDLDNNINLINLYCQDNQFNGIKLNNCINLEHLRIANNPLLSLDLSGNVMLKRLYFAIDKFWELDITNNPNLVYLEIDEPDPKSGTFTIYMTMEQEKLGLIGPNSPEGTFKYEIIIK